MTKNRKPGSWNDPKRKTHSPEGVEELKRSAFDALSACLRSTAGSMFEWVLPEECDTMRAMSMDTAPERTLYDHGEAIVVTYGDDVHMLPAVPQEVNIYGMPLSWRIQCDAAAGRVYEDLVNRVYPTEKAVVIRNDAFGRPDLPTVDGIVRQMVDCDLSISQMQLLAGNPIAFYVTNDQLLTAKNIYLAMSERIPAVFISPYAQDGKPEVLDLGKEIDPRIFDAFDHWMSEALTYIGVPTVEISKRAQQSLAEVDAGTDKADARRAEKLRMRKWACERARKVLGIEIDVRPTDIGRPIMEEIDDDSNADADGDPEVESRRRERVPEDGTRVLRLGELPFAQRHEGAYRPAVRRDVRLPDDKRGDGGEVAGHDGAPLPRGGALLRQGVLDVPQAGRGRPHGRQGGDRGRTQEDSHGGPLRNDGDLRGIRDVDLRKLRDVGPGLRQPDRHGKRIRDGDRP